ncbi:HET-domain-containing protein, partial [Phaeosphaeriaceae sp. SRC1lsM3a]
MEQFSHSPLNLDRPAIRLLRLLRGIEPSVECEIFQAYLDTTRDDLIPYEALSYTWGGTERAANVQIDAKNYNVTENLYLALLHLRLPYEDRILWVDAICIDQSNLRERGHQVGQMGQIYSLASRVLIWLGHGTEETDILADPRWPDIWSSLQSDLKRQQSDIEQRHSAALQLLLNRPWFKRVWILQEVANAKRAAICCGRRSISAHSFALAPSLSKVQLEAHCQAVLDIFPGQSRDNSWWNANRDLYTLLRKFSDSHASDPRDKVFALLGICSDSGEPDSLVADYTKPLYQVMSETAMFI